MNSRFSIIGRAQQAGLAVVAAGVLVTGAAGHVAANTAAAPSAAANVTAPRTHAVAGGRDRLCGMD